MKVGYDGNSEETSLAVYKSMVDGISLRADTKHGYKRLGVAPLEYLSTRGKDRRADAESAERNRSVLFHLVGRGQQVLHVPLIPTGSLPCGSFWRSHADPE